MDTNELTEKVGLLENRLSDLEDEMREVREKLGDPHSSLTMNPNDQDPLFEEVVKLIRGSSSASASLFQRRMKIGYARAARILDELTAAGYVSESRGSKPRKVLQKKEETAAKIGSTCPTWDVGVFAIDSRWICS